MVVRLSVEGDVPGLQNFPGQGFGPESLLAAELS